MAPLLCRWALPERERLDAETRASIEALNRQIAVSSLVLSQFVVTAARLCEQEHIPYLFWKGPVLAAQLYGDPARRQYGDIDILVPPGELVRLDNLLRNNGFRPLYDLTDAQLRLLQSIGGENCYIEERGKLPLDVHWSLVTPRLSLGGDYARFSRPCSSVRIGKRDVPCPSVEQHMVMLAIHGCKHAWSSLGWLFDVASLCLKPDLHWTIVWQAARATSAERMLSVALDLCVRVFGVPLPHAATCEMVRTPALTWAARACADSLAGAEPLRGHKLGVFLAAMPGFRNRVSYLSYLFLDPTTLDFELVRLPEVLFPLYYAVRPVRLAGKHLFGVKQRLRRDK